jgi:hypothetical protein
LGAGKRSGCNLAAIRVFEGCNVDRGWLAYILFSPDDYFVVGVKEPLVDALGDLLRGPVLKEQMPRVMVGAGNV